MKKFKYFTIFTITLTTLMFSYKYHYRNKFTQTTWQTYQQKNKTVQKYNSTKSELKLARVRPEVKRAPAANESKSKEVRRITSGTHKDQFEKNQKNYSFLNRPSKKWKDKYAQAKLQFYPEGTKLLIKHKLSVLDISQKGARHLEKIVVNIIKEGLPPTSFEAFVDSESGEQIRAWNKTHHENVNKTLFIKKL